MSSIELTLYSKPECGLCDEMKELLEEVRKETPFRLKEVDISGSPELYDRYRYDIPVLCAGDEVLAKHRAHPVTIRKKLARLA